MTSMGETRKFQFGVAIVLNFLIFQLSYANPTEQIPKPFEASNEIVQEAFSALYNEAFDLIMVIAIDKDNVKRDFWSNFDLEESRARQELESSLENILRAVENITANAETNGLNVTSCAEGAKEEISDFAKELNSSLPECMSRSLAEAFDLIDQTWADVMNVFESSIGCAKRSMVECETYEDNDQCLEFVLSLMPGNKQRLLSSLNYLHVIILNEFQTYRLPCRDLIVNQMGLYPSLIAGYVNSCIARTSQEMVSNVC